VPQERAVSIGIPVPLRLAVALPDDALLAIVSWPVRDPADVGTKTRLSVDVCPGANVRGNVAPVRVNPVPVTVALVTVTGPVPVDVRVTDWAEVEFTATEPKATLEELMPNVDVQAFSWIAKPRLAPPELAARVTDWAEVADETVAEKPALVAPLGTKTVAGTVTAGLLLDSAIAIPPLGAAPDRLTVHASVPAPVYVLVPQERELKVDAATPAPLMFTTALAFVEELLEIVITPV
jgi:hypothetical protein